MRIIGIEIWMRGNAVAVLGTARGGGGRAKKQGVPTAEAFHRHSEGERSGGAGNC